MIHHIRVIKILVIRILISICDSNIKGHFSYYMLKKHHFAVGIDTELNEEWVATSSTRLAANKQNCNETLLKQ